MGLAVEDPNASGTCLTDVEGIILAAGLSKRAGVFKLTLELDGKTILERCIEGMCGFCSRLIIVCGYRAAEILPIIKRYPRAEPVMNIDYMDGMYSSVLKGLENLRCGSGSGRFFLTPGDYPLISPVVYEKMLAADGDIIVPSCYGKNGHPVLIKSRIANEIAGSGYYSLKDFIDSWGYTKLEVQDRGILLDVDTIEDYEQIRRDYSELSF
ncbi:MAG TPA: nucleotidyltransferase family protein [Clostridia bacterium]|nr:nucleotidyltransferase family protein [Clostridia bacterium]